MKERAELRLRALRRSFNREFLEGFANATRTAQDDLRETAVIISQSLPENAYGMGYACGLAWSYQLPMPFSIDAIQSGGPLLEGSTR